ncbi:MAG: tetratricopeptide repeat protein [Phycisphaerae bacterium]|nr:tetratricopeptide repeat protein [Phycisphaerae bacterium]
MARKLNKNLVGLLTLFGMVLLAAAGFAMLLNLPTQDPKVYEVEAEELEAQGEHNRAMQTYVRAYKKDSTRNPKYLVMAARSAVEDGKIGAAQEFLNQALVRDSELPAALEATVELHFELARLFRGKLRWNRVLDDARKFLQVDPESPLAHYALGLACLSLKEDDESYEAEGEKALRRALELDPANVDVVESLATQLWSSARRADAEGRKTEAGVLWETLESTLASAIEKCRGLGEEEKVVDLRRLEAFFLIMRGEKEPIGRGVALLKELVKTETAGTDCHLLLAQVYASGTEGVERDFAKAAAVLEDGLKIDPKAARLYEFLGEVYGYEGKVEEQAAVYRRGLEAVPHRDHFRAIGENQMRMQFMTDLFMQELSRASQARLASDEGKATEALAAAEEWIARAKEEADEQSLGVRFMSAQLFKARGDYVAATQEAEAASRVANADRHFELQRLLGELYMRQQQWGKARAALEAALKLKPRSPVLYVWLGQVHLKLGDPAKALEVLKPNQPKELREYLEGNELATELRMKAYEELGQFELAAAEGRRLGQGTVEGELRLVEVLLAEGRDDEAEQKIKAVLEKDPENGQALLALLRLYVTADRVGEARAMVASLLAKDPDSRLYQRFDLLVPKEGDAASKDEQILAFLKGKEDGLSRALSLARFYRIRRQPDEERKCLDEAERLQPGDRSVVRQQFDAALRAEDWDRAERYAARFGELNIDGTSGKVAEGRVALAKGEFDQAIELMKTGLGDYPSYSMGWTYLAEAYLAAEDVEAAKDALRRALEIDPTNGIANRGLARIAVGEGDRQAERKYLELARKFRPNDPWVAERYQIMKETENPDEGIEAREKVRKADPKNLENLIFLARLYGLAEVGAYDKAAKVYREALELSDYDLDLVREVAFFLGRKEVNRLAEGEALLMKPLKAEEDPAKKALIAVYLGRFYEEQQTLATADRHFRLAVSLDPSPKVLILAAEFYSRNNRERDALEYYERAVKRMEEESAAGKGNAALVKSTRSRIIGLFLATGDLEEAKQRIDDYVERYPDDPQGMIFEGAYHRIGGNIQKSKEAFDGYLEKHPDSALVLWQRGQLHILMGQWQAAISDLKSAKIYSPAGFGYQHRISLANALIEVGRGDEAINELELILDENPEGEAEYQAVAAALVDAYLRVRPARYADAENLIYRHMRQYPKELRWPMLLGRLGERSQDWNKAIEGYEAAAELARYRSGTVPALFAAYRSAGRPADIIRFAEEKLSARLLDNQPDALASLAWAYARGGDESKCFETYGRALAAAKDFPKQTQIVAEMRSVFGEEAVLARIRARVEANPENVANLEVLVHLLYISGKSEEAIDICDRIAEVAVNDTDKVFAALAQGLLLESLHRHLEAKAKYEEALKIDPQQRTALNNLAYLLADQLDNAAEALPYAWQAYRLKSDDSGVLDTLGWALAKSDRLVEAEGMLLRALEIDRRNVAAAFHWGMVQMLRGGELEEAKGWLNSMKTAAEASEDQSVRRTLPKINEALKDLEKAAAER